MSGKFCIKADMQLCQGHGDCAEEAPDIFAVDYDTSVYPKVKILQAMPDPSLRDKAEAAIRYCPNKVLRLEEIS